MPEPLTLIALGAAIGGAAGKFVERAWDSGEKWIVSYYANHHEKAKENAIKNSTEFLADLGQRVANLEAEENISEQDLRNALEHPDFSAVLQKATISAAQTENRDKHALLSRLVTERLLASPDSLLSMTTKMACDVVSFITPNQLHILALLANLLYINPSEKLDEASAIEWLVHRLSPFLDATLSPVNYAHLESLSCMNIVQIISRDLKKILENKLESKTIPDRFLSLEIGEKIHSMWTKDGLQVCTLTTVGQMLGVMVTDQMQNVKTNFSGWE